MISVCPTKENASCITSPAQVWSSLIPEYHFSRWKRTRYDNLYVSNTQSFTKCLYVPYKYKWGLLSNLIDKDTEGIEMLSHLPMITQYLLLCLVPLLAFVYLLITGCVRAALRTPHLGWCNWAMLPSHSLPLPCVLESTSNLFNPPPCTLKAPFLPSLQIWST